MYNDILNKMKKLIETTPVEHKDVLERWISLANVSLHKEFDERGNWAILGGSLALKQAFETKFGTFSVQNKAINL